MRGHQELREKWERDVAWGAARTEAFLTDAGLVLGAGTVLARMRIGAAGGKHLDVDGDHDRLVALLSVLKRGAVSPGIPEALAKSAEDWRRGEKALAQIRLAFLDLPRVESRDDAYRLHLADLALSAGLAPEDLLKELGFPGSVLGLLKRGVDVGSRGSQPREPAGQPTGGQFASYGDSASAGAPPPAKPPVRTAFLDTNTKTDESPPAAKEEPDVFLGLEPRNHTYGPFVPVMPPISIGPAPAAGASTAPTLLDQLADAPRKESDCPPSQPDVKHGLGGAAWQQIVNILANPTSPTPPDQAYFLPNPYRGGAPTSYDDCIKTSGPNGIPGSQKGDMVEAKNKVYDFLLTHDMGGSNQTWGKLIDQIMRQNEAIEGSDRYVFYCFEGQVAADEVNRKLKGRYPKSKFMKCQ